MKRVLLGCMICLCCFANAQDSPLGVRVAVAYGWSDQFLARNGSSITLTGPEFSADFPLLSSHGYELALEPSYFAAGRFIAGGTQGDVFHFTLLGTKTFSGGFYVKGGVGFAHGSSGDGQFASTQGIVGELGVGIPIGKSWGGRFDPCVDLTYFAGDSGQLRGFFLGLTATF